MIPAKDQIRLMVADYKLTAPPVDIKDSETQEAESGMALPFVIYCLMFFFHGRKSRKNTESLLICLKV